MRRLLTAFLLFSTILSASGQWRWENPFVKGTNVVLTGVISAGIISGYASAYRAMPAFTPAAAEATAMETSAGVVAAEDGVTEFVAARGIGSFFQGGRIAKASELVGYAEQQGWKAVQSAGGPLKYVDENGIIRMTIKQGSQRAADSGYPHVELRNALGKRIDPLGNEVLRKGLGNHTEIFYDLK